MNIRHQNHRNTKIITEQYVLIIFIKIRDLHLALNTIFIKKKLNKFDKEWLLSLNHILKIALDILNCVPY